MHFADGADGAGAGTWSPVGYASSTDGSLKLYDGLPYHMGDTPSLNPRAKHSYGRWQLNLHKLFLSDHSSEYATLWGRFEQDVGDALEAIALPHRQTMFYSWADEMQASNPTRLQLDERTPAYSVAVCKALKYMTLHPFDRMQSKAAAFCSIEHDRKADACNSIILVRILSTHDRAVLSQEHDPVCKSVLHYYEPVAAARDGDGDVGMDSNSTLWVCQVKRFYQFERPGHAVLPMHEREWYEFADAKWFRLPDAGARLCPVLNVPVVMQSFYRDDEYDAHAISSQLVWCRDIVPTNVALLPFKQRVGGQRGHVELDGSKWHVLHRDAGFHVKRF